MRHLIFATWIISATAPIGVAQTENSSDAVDDARSRAEQAAEFSAREAARYDIVHEGEEPVPLKWREESILRWSNPVRGEIYGDVYVWTRDGRPEAIASVYRFYSPFDKLDVEFQSLSEGRLTAVRNGRTVWTPGPTIELKPVPGAPQPADSRSKRLLQMRSLARRFTAQIAERQNQDRFEETRLLARPLYRFETGEDGDRDGALFVFTIANDPELALLIETKPTDDGPAWFYSAARMTYRRLRLSCDGQQVWEGPQIAPPWSNTRDPKQPFRILEWKTLDETES